MQEARGCHSPSLPHFRPDYWGARSGKRARVLVSYSIRLSSSAPVIPERRLRRIRDRNGRRAFVTIPDNAVGISGMTAAEAIERI